MSFSMSDIRPSLAQFAPQLCFCILLLLPTLSCAASHCLAGTLHILPIAELPRPDHSHLNTKVNLSKQAGVAGFRMHAFNLMGSTPGRRTVVIPALRSARLLPLWNIRTELRFSSFQSLHNMKSVLDLIAYDPVVTT
jgi:hypothetical protein